MRRPLEELAGRTFIKPANVSALRMEVDWGRLRVWVGYSDQMSVEMKRIRRNSGLDRRVFDPYSTRVGGCVNFI